MEDLQHVALLLCTAPFYAYGVINDQLNSDGSFVNPTLPTGGAPDMRLTIQAMVEKKAYKKDKRDDGIHTDTSNFCEIC